MAWRAPAVNMVRQSAPPPEEAGNQTGAAHPVPNPIPAAAAVFDPTDRTNPLYLHPNESPALQLVTAQLEGRSNYHSWARAMEMALRSKNKLSFVNGTMVIPSSLDAKYYYWDQCNTMVLSWIMRAVSPTIGCAVLWINTAEGVWKDLKKRFSQQDVFRIAQIQSEIHQIKQDLNFLPLPLFSTLSSSFLHNIHGPDGGAGDKNVDLKATSYIFQVKERLRLEELKIMNENLKLGL
nr:uncharacterized protein LOC109166898 [Ipomoea batatas]